MILIKTYRTTQVADIIGVHPNTVRLYEQWGFIPKAERQDNGYRIFTDFHISVFQLARLAFQIEVLQSGLRKTMLAAIRAIASSEFDTALQLLNRYLLQVSEEQLLARESIEITRQLLAGNYDSPPLSLTRRKAAEHLHISTDTLRNWELNGLLTVKRSENGYRIYTAEDITRLKIIRTLRCASYSLEAILRMLTALDNCTADSTTLAQLLNTPHADEDIISVCDQLLISLEKAEQNALLIREKLKTIISEY